MEELRRAVSNCMQRLSLGLISKELQIFSRLVYRNKSQHHRDKSFQKLVRVSKDLKRYQSAALPNYLKGLTKLLPSSGPLQLLPPGAQEHANVVIAKLMDCATFTAKLIAFAEESFGDVHQRLAMSLFVPFNLLMAASLSRIWFILRYHLLAISQMFDTLRPFVSEGMKAPLSIAKHLDKCYRKYLTKPVTIQPVASQGSRAENLKVLSTSMDKDNTSNLHGIEESVDTKLANQVKDVGVRVALNKEQLTCRQKDFALPSKPMSTHEPLNRQPVPAPATTHVVARVAGTRRKPNAIIIYSQNGRRVLKVMARNRTLLSKLEWHAGTTALVARDIRLCKKIFPRSPFHRYMYSLRLCAVKKAPRKPQKLQMHSLQPQLGDNEGMERWPEEEEAVQELQLRFAEEMEAASHGPTGGLEFHCGDHVGDLSSPGPEENLDENQETLLERTASSATSRGTVSEKDDIDDIFRLLESTDH